MTAYRRALRGYLPDRPLVEAIQWHERHSGSTLLVREGAEAERILIADQRRLTYRHQRRVRQPKAGGRSG